MKCPNCDSPELQEQPQPGTHAFTTKYECGFETITVLSTGDVVVEKKCPKESNK